MSLVIAFTLQPGVRLEFDRDLPRLTSGFHPAEIVRDDSFAWTGRSAVLRMPGADRRRTWTCSVRFRGGRSAPLEQPTVAVAADGLTLASLRAENEYQTLEVSVPPHPARGGLVLTITSSTTFVPGPGDRRELGVQVDRVECRRADGGLHLPPRRASTSAAVSAAAFGAAFTLLGIPLAGALAATTLLAIAQALPLATGFAPYSSYADRAGPLATWIVLATLGIALAAARWRPLSGAGRFVFAFSAGALFLQLLALLHPSKLVIDAVFHAHRFEWVLGGRYYFTQPMPDGVEFPYAIALYLFAIPWSGLTDDHVTLLRVVVCAAHAVAGALLYPMIVRAWHDRTAGAIAVVLFHLVPLPYIVIGNANLTYAFGQSAAFVAVAAATTWSLDGRRLDQLAALTLLAALAFLSHVGVFPVLLTALVASALFYWTLGGAPLRVPGRHIFVAAIAAAVFSLVAYYGQFSQVYKSLDRVRGRSVAAVIGGAETPTAGSQPAIPVHQRARTVVRLALRAFGWPIVLLALAGVWDATRTRGRDRLTLALAGLAVTYAIFVGFAALTPVEPRFQKYSDEFIDRVNYATMPLVLVLSARTASRAAAHGLGGRIAAGALITAAAVLGIRQWTAWLA